MQTKHHGQSHLTSADKSNFVRHYLHIYLHAFDAKKLIAQAVFAHCKL